MEIKEVNFKRFIANKGMALKWKELYWNSCEKKFVEGYTWAIRDAVIDVNSIIGKVEEIPLSQYEEETKCCAIDLRRF